MIKSLMRPAYAVNFYRFMRDVVRNHAAIIDVEESDVHEVNDLIDHIQKSVHRVILLPKISKTPMVNGELISSIHHKGMAFYVKNNLLSTVYCRSVPKKFFRLSYGDDAGYRVFAPIAFVIQYHFYCNQRPSPFYP